MPGWANEFFTDSGLALTELDQVNVMVRVICLLKVSLAGGCGVTWRSR